MRAVWWEPGNRIWDEYLKPVGVLPEPATLGLRCIEDYSFCNTSTDNKKLVAVSVEKLNAY